MTARTFLGKRGDNLDRFLLRVKETAESFRTLSQTLQTFKFSSRQPKVERADTLVCVRSLTSESTNA